MNGQRPKSVTVRLNGERLEQSKQALQPRVVIGESHAPAIRAEVPPVPTVPDGGKNKAEDAWERLLQLRSIAAQPDLQEQENGWSQPYEEAGFLSGRERRFGQFRLFEKGPVIKTLLTTGGAVAVGLVFGFLVLTVFTQEQLSQSYRTVLNGTVESLTAQDVGKSSASQGIGPVLPASGEEGTAGADIQVALELPEQRYFVAQAGAFQPDVTASAAVEPLEKQGLPHMLYQGDDKQYLFAAAAPTRDEILGFASDLKAKGIDVYVKEMVFPPVNREVSVKQGEQATHVPDLNRFFLTGLELSRTLASQASQVVNAEKLPESIAAGTELKEKHRRFLEDGRAAGIADDWQPFFSGMMNGLNQAVAAQEKMAEAVDGKKSEIAESYAWQVQAGVLTFLENYNKWMRIVHSDESQNS